MAAAQLKRIKLIPASASGGSTPAAASASSATNSSLRSSASICSTASIGSRNTTLVQQETPSDVAAVAEPPPAVDPKVKAINRLAHALEKSEAGFASYQSKILEILGKLV